MFQISALRTGSALDCHLSALFQVSGSTWSASQHDQLKFERVDAVSFQAR
jgi:hypothetical protein